MLFHALRRYPFPFFPPLTMPYVKIDQDVLDSSVWPNRNRRSVWFTMLIMARPVLLEEPVEALDVETMAPAGFHIGAGRYGIVRASSEGIAQRDGCQLADCLEQLASLASPDRHSRSPEWDGRRIARIAGGYLVLNYAKYRDEQESSTQRVRKWRERQKQEREARNGGNGNGNGETVTATSEKRRETHGDVDGAVDGAVDGKKYPPIVPPQEGGQPVTRSRALTANGNGRRVRPDRGEAALIINQILKLQRRHSTGNGGYIVRGDVEALGLHIAAAFDAVGGTDRFLKAEGERRSYLTRDFAEALAAARRLLFAE